MSFNMLPEVDSKGLKNYPCFSGEGRHLIVGVAGAFEKSSNEMFNSIWRIMRDNEKLNPAMTTCGSMIDSVNIVSVDSSATMTGWKNTRSNDLNYPITFIGDVNGEFTRKMGMSTVFADGSTRSWFYFAMVSDGFFDVWTPAKDSVMEQKSTRTRTRTQMLPTMLLQVSRTKSLTTLMS